ncbi:MAG: ATP-binding protein [Actinoplanes sp.]
MTEPADPGYLDAALEVLRLRLQRADPQETAEAERDRDELRKSLDEQPLDRITRSFGLTDFERDILLMCAGVELDTAFAHECAAAQGDPDRTYATFSLALSRFPEGRWSAASPAGPLRRWRLVELADPAEPATGPVHVTERALHALLGNDYLDPEVEPYTDRSAGGTGVAALPTALRGGSEAVAAAVSGDPVARIMVHGLQSADLLAVAAAGCRSAGLTARVLSAAAIPRLTEDQERLARLCERETRLSGTCWLFDFDAGRQSAVLGLATKLEAPVLLVARDPVAAPWSAVVAVRRPTGTELREAWRLALGPVAGPLAGWIDRVSGQFDLSLDTVRAVAAEVGATELGATELGAAEPTEPEALGVRLWEACRDRARPALGGLTERIEPRIGADDVVLPAMQQNTLRQIVTHVRHRLVVLEDWGFAARGSRGLGTAALFAGPSGTGKTLAAEAIAGALRLDLHRVDLSRTVSKYIGETEKNLGRIFDAAEAGGAVLLFDEADALFGKRSDVKDSHDRHANIEVGYLLQRVEAFRGLSILTTNLKDSLDQAFLRRLRFVLDFPFPDAAAREQIWRRVFPAATPTDGLDPVALAKLSISGGVIQGIALAAAFAAADAGEPVRMRHVLTAARTEYAKLGRPLTAAELPG